MGQQELHLAAVLTTAGELAYQWTPTASPGPQASIPAAGASAVAEGTDASKHSKCAVTQARNVEIHPP